MLSVLCSLCDSLRICSREPLGLEQLFSVDVVFSMLQVAQIRAYVYKSSQKKEPLDNEAESTDSSSRVQDTEKSIPENVTNVDIASNIQVDWSEFPDFSCQEAAMRCMTNIMHKSSKVSSEFCEVGGFDRFVFV